MEGWDGFGGSYYEERESINDTQESEPPPTKVEPKSRPVAFDGRGVLLTPPFLWRAISWMIATFTIGFLLFAFQSLTDTQVALGAFVTIVLGLAAGEFLPILKKKIEKWYGS